MTFGKTSSTLRLALGATALTLIGTAAQADFVINDDLIVDGSACIGFDCVNGESFGFDTLRLKENNTRIKFDDTSSSASFPRNKWELTANETSNGGAEKFSITDVTNGKVPFTITGNAPSNSLFMNSAGRIGFGTSTPVVELHVKDGDTPTLRLEQDGSSGFTAQTWDVAGNETNFFVRDATNGSRLPFRIRPSAPSQSLFIDTDGDIGIGTSSPDAGAQIHIRQTDGTAQLLIDDASSTASNTRIQLKVENDNGAAQLSLNDIAASADWRVQSLGGNLQLTKAGTGVTEFLMDAAGNVTTTGTVNGVSDKNRKMAIQEVDARQILEKVDALPIAAWTYKHEADVGTRHIGPMAQDFYALFGTGPSDKVIALQDVSGVALAAIKALSQENDELRRRLEALESRLAAE